VPDIETVGAVVRALEDKLRTNQVDPGLLRELGWTERDAATWVERFKRELHLPDLAGAERPDGIEAGANPDFAGILRGGEASGGIIGGEGDERTRLSPDQIRRLYESRRNDIPPEYRRAFEEYLKELELRARRESAQNGGN
jgi:hypothetical protein